MFYLIQPDTQVTERSVNEYYRLAVPHLDVMKLGISGRNVFYLKMGYLKLFSLALRHDREVQSGSRFRKLQV